MMECLGLGLQVNNDNTPYIWHRSTRHVPANLLAGATFTPEVTFYNNSAFNCAIDFVNSSGSVLDTITLPPTGGATVDKVTRKRSTNALSLTTGTYRWRTTGPSAGRLGILRARLFIAQLDPAITLESYPLLAAGGDHPQDLSGIAGADLYRTTALTYVPTMAHDGAYPAGIYDEVDQVKHNLAWFKYQAAQWPQLSAAYIESTCDGFADHSWAALYAVDPTSAVQTLVTSSEAVHDNSDNPLTIPAISSNFALGADGYYALRMKAQWIGMAANAFFYSGWLNLISDAGVSGTAHGRNYWLIGNNNTAGECRSKPERPDGFGATLEMATFQHPSIPTNFIYNDGTADTGDATADPTVTGSGVALTAPYIKGVFDSGNIAFVNLPNGNRYTAQNANSNGIAAFIAEDYAISTTVPPPNVDTPCRLEIQTVGVAINIQLRASGGGGGPYVFTLVSGRLPRGVTLSSSGLISGIPLEEGVFSFTVRVDNA